MSEKNINDINYMWPHCLRWMSMGSMYNPENCVKVAFSEQAIFLKQIDHIILFPKKFACVYTNIFVFI